MFVTLSHILAEPILMIFVNDPDETIKTATYFCIKLKGGLQMRRGVKFLTTPRISSDLLQTRVEYLTKMRTELQAKPNHIINVQTFIYNK